MYLFSCSWAKFLSILINIKSNKFCWEAKLHSLHFKEEWIRVWFYSWLLRSLYRKMETMRSRSVRTWNLHISPPRPLFVLFFFLAPSHFLVIFLSTMSVHFVIDCVAHNLPPPSSSNHSHTRAHTHTPSRQGCVSLLAQLSLSFPSCYFLWRCSVTLRLTLFHTSVLIIFFRCICAALACNFFLFHCHYRTCLKFFGLLLPPLLFPF